MCFYACMCTYFHISTKPQIIVRVGYITKICRLKRKKRGLCIWIYRLKETERVTELRRPLRPSLASSLLLYEHYGPVWNTSWRLRVGVLTFFLLEMNEFWKCVFGWNVNWKCAFVWKLILFCSSHCYEHLATIIISFWLEIRKFWFLKFEFFKIT